MQQPGATKKGSRCAPTCGRSIWRSALDEVPKTSVGNFDRKVLRKQYADGELDVQELPPPQG
jgi:acyl-CoA synthetase (AMP-forming)/AMP-acid ligase II